MNHNKVLISESQRGVNIPCKDKVQLQQSSHHDKQKNIFVDIWCFPHLLGSVSDSDAMVRGRGMIRVQCSCSLCSVTQTFSSKKITKIDLLCPHYYVATLTETDEPFW